MASTKQRELEQSKQHHKPATRIEILSRKRKKWMYSLTTVQVPYSEIPFTSGKSTNFSFINLGSWLGLGLGLGLDSRGDLPPSVALGPLKIAPGPPSFTSPPLQFHLALLCEPCPPLRYPLAPENAPSTPWVFLAPLAHLHKICIQDDYL